MFKRYTCAAIRRSRGFRTSSLRRSDDTGARKEDIIRLLQENSKPNIAPKFRAKRLSQENFNEIQALSADAPKSNPNLRTGTPATNDGEGYTARSDRIATEYFANGPRITYQWSSNNKDGPDSFDGTTTPRPQGGIKVQSVNAPEDRNSVPVRDRGQSAGRPARGGRGKPREEKRDRVGKGNRDEKPESEKPKYTEEEMAYLTEKALKDKPKEVPHEPAEVNLESLVGSGPTIPLGEFGMRNIITDRMITAARRRPGEYAMMDQLAKRIIAGKFVAFESEDEEKQVMKLVDKMMDQLAERRIAGEFVAFESEDEKKQVMKLVDEMNAGRASRETDRKGEIVKKEEASFETVDDESKGKIMEKLLAGRYPAFEAGQDNLIDALKTVNRNGSYLPDDRNKLMRKVTELVQSAGSRQERPASVRQN
ncbi:MAG: hypothetical protein M1812_003122 [Candelaria pacifica]|nr:MAG: hypothetical protein M1812_003122 [Candelaria pacifica]